jgi:DNA-binding response OmpR family regulator
MEHRVLVVDDDPVVSSTVRRYPGQDGHRVRLESEGIAAPRAVKPEYPVGYRYEPRA